MPRRLFPGQKHRWYCSGAHKIRDEPGQQETSDARRCTVREQVAPIAPHDSEHKREERKHNHAEWGSNVRLVSNGEMPLQERYGHGCEVVKNHVPITPATHNRCQTDRNTACMRTADRQRSFDRAGYLPLGDVVSLERPNGGHKLDCKEHRQCEPGVNLVRATLGDRERQVDLPRQLSHPEKHQRRPQL